MRLHSDMTVIADKIRTHDLYLERVRQAVQPRLPTSPIVSRISVGSGIAFMLVHWRPAALLSESLSGHGDVRSRYRHGLLEPAACGLRRRGAFAWAVSRSLS